MQIEFDTARTNPDELTALIALCASLGGRLPDHVGKTTVENIVVKVSADTTDLAAALAAAGNEPSARTDTANTALSASENAPNADNSSPSDGSPTTGEIELDADGIPWDERIHASTKTKTKKRDVWTKKRDVDEVLYGQVHAELQELHARPLDDTPPPPSSTSDENAPTADTDVPPPPAPDALAGSDTAPATAEGFAEFPELVQAVAQYGLPYVKLGELAASVTDGLVAKFPDLRDKPDYWSDFFAAVKKEVGA